MSDALEQLIALGDTVKRLVEENAQLRAQIAGLRAPILALAEMLRGDAPLVVESTMPVQELNAVGDPGDAPQKKSTHNTVTPEMEARWQEAHAHGIAINTIAREAGVDFKTVKKHLGSAATLRRGGLAPIAPEKVAEWRKLYAAGMSPTAIANKDGVSWSSVAKYVKGAPEEHCRKCGVLLTATEPGLPPAKDGLCGYCVEEGE